MAVAEQWLEDVLVRRTPPGVLEVVLAEPVAVERVEQVHGLLCGAVGEVVGGWYGFSSGFVPFPLEKGHRSVANAAEARRD